MVLVVLISGSQYVNAQKKSKKDSRRIIVEGKVPPGYNKDSIELTTFPIERITYTSEGSQTSWKKLANGTVKWDLTTSDAVYLTGPFVGRPSVIGYQLEPGERISVRYKRNEPLFSGSAAEKFRLIYRLGRMADSLENTSLFKGLSEEYKPLNSLEDYFAWNAYLNKKLSLTLALIDAYKPKISAFAFNTIKEKALYVIEEQRMGRFFWLTGAAQANDGRSNVGTPINQFGLTNQDLCAIYDSTMNGAGAKWLQYEAPLVGDPYYLWEILKLDAYRQKEHFFKDRSSDTSILGKSKADAYLVRYELAKKKYKGLIREEVLAFFFHYIRGVLYNVGFDPKVEAMLADYYSQPGYPAYKSAVKKYELVQRDKQAGKRDLDFVLTDSKDRPFTKAAIKGKIAVFDFWFTGCKGCVQMAPVLRSVEDTFKIDTNVVFLNVSVDKDKARWIKSIAQQKYTTGGGINLYTGGEGSRHQMIRNFAIEAYPELLLLDAYGKIIYDHSRTDPRIDSGKSLIALIRKQLVLMKDGPYVLHKDDSIIAYSINGQALINEELNKDVAPSFQVQTDQLGKSFRVVLKRSLSIEPSDFQKPDKIFALSDIEGNFDAFRKLLQANKVVDKNYNWIFGNGHLVFAGDMFDRGNQVTECLWLVYALEEKARAAGGYVHFILGNHELMNLQGDHRYTRQKYMDNAGLMGQTLAQLYNENGELGRWLRTKNVIEKIGDILFMHAGISSGLNRLPVTINEINQLARPYYDEKKADYNDERLNVILSQSLSPFWYRGYYYNNTSLKYQIDSTLRKFDVNKIITGHTIVSDTISVHQDGRLINIDTKHAEGRSEALLIEEGHYYRVNNEGRRRLLFLRSEREDTDVVVD